MTSDPKRAVPVAPPEPEIHRAARLGDVVSLERLVSSGVPVDTRGDLEFDHGPSLRGLTALMVAACSADGADVATLEWLLAHGADLRATSQAGVTAAWYAAGRGGRWRMVAHRAEAPPVERLRLLLDLGLDPREGGWNGRSLLCEACNAGDPTRVALLLERGAQPSPRWGPDERTRHQGSRDAFHSYAAAQLAADPNFAALLDVGPRIADVAAGAFAMRAGNGDAGAGVGPPARCTPMFVAAASGSAECVRLLLRAGAPPDARDEDGLTPLMVAASAAVVRGLVDAGADLRAESPGGEDVIDRALARSGDDGVMPDGGPDVAAELVARGAALARIGPFGFSRLARAASHRNADAVNWLLAQGVRPAPDSSDRRTPLPAICWSGEMGNPDANARCERVIRALAEAGDEVEARDDGGRSPMSEAVAGDWGNPTAVRVLLALGARPDAPSAEGTTPLMLAASLGELECVRLLLEAGADPARQDGGDRSALDHAREHHTIWVKLLREASRAQRATRRDALAKAKATLHLLEDAVRRR